MAPKSLTPKRVARAIGVSESSLKRWCDRGLIESVKTAGGHRRLSLDSVLEFLRSTNREPLHPELLGLPPAAGGGFRSLDCARTELAAALLAGDDTRCRQVLFNLHLSGQRISRIADEVISPVFHGIGEQWACRSIEVYHERRSCEHCLRALYELRAALPEPAADAPVAIGGTPECDPYGIATTLADLVLRQAGWRSESLGTRLPFTTLLAAIGAFRPRLFWLSVSHLNDPQDFLHQYRTFVEQVGPETAVVVGGQALTESLRSQMRYTAFCDSMQRLEPLAETLAGRRLTER